LSYDYETQKPNLLTPQGQKGLFEVRALADERIETAGAVTMTKATNGCSLPNSWDRLAAMDYLVELGELREIPQENVRAQDRIFVKGG